MSMDTPDAMFAEISRFIEDSNTLLDRGEFTRLTGFDKQINMLCQQALALNGEERAAYADKLQQVMQGLEALEKKMVAAREAIVSEMHGLNVHKKANVAYQKIERSDKKS